MKNYHVYRKNGLYAVELRNFGHDRPIKVISVQEKWCPVVASHSTEREAIKDAHKRNKGASLIKRLR